MSSSQPSSPRQWAYPVTQGSGRGVTRYPPGETPGGCPGWKPSALPFPGLVPAPPRRSWGLHGSLRSRSQSLCCPRRSRWGRPRSGWNQSLPLSVALGSETCNKHHEHQQQMEDHYFPGLKPTPTSAPHLKRGIIKLACLEPLAW